jgi:hypothetical protein
MIDLITQTPHAMLDTNAKTGAMLQKYREKMVGVTGIEPVTPTMST